jgi:flagellar basal-body rod modification protein FlgD
MSTTTAISGTGLPTAADPAAAAALPQQTLSQNDFLKLLVTQMQSQDPMNPQQDTSFIAQMAQFSALQATQNMGNQLGAMQQTDQVGQASSLLGRYVTLQNGQDAPITGLVTGVTIKAGMPQLTVGGKSYDLSQVVGIAPAAFQPPPGT